MAGKLYVIYYPINRDQKGIGGGPLCIMTGQVPAYAAFHSENLAEVFRKRVGSPEGGEILLIDELGPAHPELVKGVNHLLVFPSAKVLDEYFTARKDRLAFPYQQYLVARSGTAYIVRFEKPAQEA